MSTLFPKRQPRYCIHCNKPLQPSLGTKPRKFCSKHCRQNHWLHERSENGKQIRELTKHYYTLPELAEKFDIAIETLRWRLTALGLEPQRAGYRIFLTDEEAEQVINYNLLDQQQ